MAWSFIARVGHCVKVGLLAGAAVSVAACSGERTAPESDLADMTEAIHEDQTLTLAFDLYWFDEGIQLDGDNRDFWVNGKINGSP